MSEETEQSSEVKDEGLAEEALEATATTEDETSPAEKSAKEPMVPLHDHTALRTRAQEAELEAANLRGQITAMQSQQASQAPAAKSPLQLEVERQAAEGIAEEDMTVSPRIIRAQEIHNRQIATQEAQAEASRALGAKQLVSANKAKAVHDDWSQVVKAADGLLTQGELVDIAAEGENFGEVAYAKSQAALARNKPESETKTAPEKKQSKSEADKAAAEKAAAEEVPSQQEILKSVEGDPAAIAAAQL